MKDSVDISIEFFPPKNEAGQESMLEAARELKQLNPKFVTVTFGAGGSTRSGTLDTAKLLQEKLDLTVGAHLSYFGTTKKNLFAYADLLWDSNIRHLVALRGDIPEGFQQADFCEPEYFEYTSEFVEALINRHDFDISVGAYPEKHPDAPSLHDDIIALEKKCNAGAARAITQFFFEPSVFHHFLQEIENFDIKTPIVPGLLPVRDFEKIQGFCKKCQASIPEETFDYFNNSANTTETGIAYLANQITELYHLGVRHFHFYSLNQADMILEACRRSGIISSGLSHH